MTIAELLKELGENKKQSNEVYKTYKALRADEDLLKTELMVQLRDAGLKTAKGQDFTASIAEKPTIIVKHEQSVLEWLKNTPDIESDLYIGVKAQAFNTLATAMLKNTGELIDGTELETRESLSIRRNK